MKKFHSPFSSRRGFSLIELLVVVSIIVILAGIGLATFSKVKKSQAIDLTRVRIKDAGVKLNEYFNENGFFPVGDDASSAALYKALSGDPTGTGQKPSGTTYWKELLNKDPSLVGDYQGQKVILDGFIQSLRYRSALDADGQKVQNVKNDGSYDLWSVGPDGEPKDMNVDGNSKTEQTQDDIW